LYQALGIYLPLITTNCAILGLTLINVQNQYSLLETVFNSLGAGVGYGMSMILFAGIREQLDLVEIPEPFKGFSGALVTAGLMSMAFMGFNGMIKL
ncbi:MAG TPA: Rnf-Nqr domain containing protein, partial [Thermotogota bacterium]|nr:Rnf-Nqr domain containing protein [Thermotogota bacterium]